MALTVRDGNGVLQTMQTTLVNGEHVTHNLREWQGPRPTTLYRYLDLNGDGTGSKQATGNYSGAADEFYIQPGVSAIYRIYAMMVHIRDTSVNDSGNYGAITGPLTNGITMAVADGGGTLIDLTDNVPIKTNSDWARIAGIDIVQGVYTAGDEYLSVMIRFDLADAPLRLDGSASERFAVTLNDDFSGLTDHRFHVYGYDETASS